MQETRVWSLDQEDLLEKEMATHSSTLAWEISWTEESGGIQSTELQKESAMSQWLNNNLLYNFWGTWSSIHGAKNISSHVPNKPTPGGPVVKNLPANARDTGSIPESGRSLAEGNGNPPQYFAWEIP